MRVKTFILRVTPHHCGFTLELKAPAQQNQHLAVSHGRKSESAGPTHVKVPAAMYRSDESFLEKAPTPCRIRSMPSRKSRLHTDLVRDGASSADLFQHRLEADDARCPEPPSYALYLGPGGPNLSRTVSSRGLNQGIQVSPGHSHDVEREPSMGLIPLLYHACMAIASQSAMALAPQAFRLLRISDALASSRSASFVLTNASFLC